MVFFSVVWMVVSFKINCILPSFLIYWNQNIIPSRKTCHKVLCPVWYKQYLKQGPCFELKTSELKWYFFIASFNSAGWFLSTFQKFVNSLIYWNQNYITVKKWLVHDQKVLSLVWNENLVFYIFPTHTVRSNLQSYIFLCFAKSMKNNFSGFLSCNQWKTILFNHEDLLGWLFLTSSKFSFKQ